MPATKNINAEKIQGILSGVTSVSSPTISGSTGFFDSISATTYQNMPSSSSRFVTGFTYSSNTFTITDNSGTTYDSTINVVTGFTVNGDLIVTGNTTSDVFFGNTFSGGTFYGDGSNLSGITDYFTTGASLNLTTKVATFTRNDNNNYTLDLSALTSGSTQFYYQPTAPTGTTTPGSFWYNSTNGDLLVYIDDGNSQQWVMPSGPVIFERRSDYQQPYLYCGEAPQGTSESTSIWNIDRITINLDGTTLTETATGAWTNRYSLIYT
jgi:hypothetical protein